MKWLPLFIIVCVFIISISIASAGVPIIQPVVHIGLSSGVGTPAGSGIITPTVGNDVREAVINTLTPGSIEKNTSGNEYGIESNGAFLFKWGRYGKGDGQFNFAQGIAVSPDGTRVYVITGGSNCIQVFDKNGGFITKLGEYGAGIAVSPDGDLIYITDMNNNRIQVYNSTGAFLTKWGEQGTGNGQFDSPRGIAVSPDGNRVYISDYMNNRVQVFNSTGVFITTWNESGSGDENPLHPMHIAVSPDGNRIYVTDEYKIKVFDPDGTFLFQWGERGTADGQFDIPGGIEISPNGNWVYESDGMNNRIQVFEAFDPNSPTISSITPSTGVNTGPVSVTLAGINFKDGATVTLNRTGSEKIIATDVVVESASRITCHLPITGRPAGEWNVEVTNLDGKTAIKEKGFTITGFSITGISPSSAEQGDTCSVSITGTSFEPDNSTVSVSGDGVTVGGYSTRTATQIVCPLIITSGATPGERTLTVTNPSSGATAPGKFTVKPNFYITNITPDSGFQGVTYALIITGKNFEPDRSTVSVSGTGVNVGKYSSRTATRIVCPFTIDSTAASGERTVTITNPSSGATATGIFTVEPGPQITGISPNSGEQGGTYAVIISGNNFEDRASTVSISGTGVNIGAYSIRTADTILFPFTIATEAELGPRTVTVTNPSFGAHTSGTFTIQPGPEVTSVLPASNTQSGLNSLTIYGDHFEAGNTTISVSGTGIKIGKPTIRTAKKIVCPITIASTAKKGVRTVTVKNRTSGAKAKGMFTLGNALAVYTITPDYGYTTGNSSVTIVGANIKPKATVKLKKGSVTKTATIQRIKSAQITCTFPLRGVLPGKYNIIVTNPDGKSVTMQNAFTVKVPGLKPTITTITPKTGTSGADTKVTITGKNFRTGAVVQMIKGSTKKKATISTLLPRKIICTLPTKGLQAGQWNVKITNTDSTSVIKSGGFTVKSRKSGETVGSTQGSGIVFSTPASVPASSVSSRSPLAGGPWVPVSVPVASQGIPVF